MVPMAYSAVDIPPSGRQWAWISLRNMGFSFDSGMDGKLGGEADHDRHDAQADEGGQEAEAERAGDQDAGALGAGLGEVAGDTGERRSGSRGASGTAGELGGAGAVQGGFPCGDRIRPQGKQFG